MYNIPPSFSVLPCGTKRRYSNHFLFRSLFIAALSFSVCVGARLTV